MSASASTAKKRDKRGEKKRKRPIAGVYIDGKLVSALQYGDLPSSFAPTIVQRTGSDYSLCNFARYIEAVGGDMSKLKAIHLVGGSRTSAITGEELRAKRDKLHFTFSRRRGTSGRPMIEWPKGGIKRTTGIDRIVDVHLFQEIEPPQWNREKRAFIWPDGKTVHEKPLPKSEEKINSPRVYLDGQLLGLVDAASLPADTSKTGDGQGSGKATDLADPEDKGKPKKNGGSGGGRRYVLAKVLEHFKVDGSSLAAVELIGEDRVLARFDKASWTQHAAELTFGIPRRSGKVLRMDAPEGSTPHAGPITVQAIALYKKSKPAEREIVKPRRRPRKR